MIGDNSSQLIEMGIVRPETQKETFTQVARAYAGRIKGLNDGKRLFRQLSFFGRRFMRKERVKRIGGLWLQIKRI